MMIVMMMVMMMIIIIIIIIIYQLFKVKAKFTLEQATKAQRGNRWR